jgi:hypothetical protein
MAKDKKIKVVKQGGDGMFGVVYFMTVIGAAVYFVQQSEDFWGFIGALLQGLVWPAFLIHDVLEGLGV